MAIRAGPNGVKGPELAKLTPNGRVPVLHDPNTAITAWESGAIINYLLRTYDTQNALGPRGASEQPQAVADFDTWTFFLVSTLAPMQGQVNWFSHAHPTRNEDALTRYREQTDRAYGVLEGQVRATGGESVLAQGFSVVDVHFLGWVNIHGFSGVALDGFPHVKKWLDGMLQRDEVKEAYRKIDSGEKM